MNICYIIFNNTGMACFSALLHSLPNRMLLLKMNALPCRSKSNIVEMLDPINNSNCFTTPKAILFGKPFHPNDFAFSFYFKTKKSMRFSTSKTNVVLRPQKLIMKRLLGIPLCVVLMLLSMGLNAQDIQVKGRVDPGEDVAFDVLLAEHPLPAHAGWTDDGRGQPRNSGLGPKRLEIVAETGQDEVVGAHERAR